MPAVAGLKVSHDTARYYLHEAQGNISKAYQMFGKLLLQCIAYGPNLVFISSSSYLASRR